MKAIVIATKTAQCLPVLLASIEAYVPHDVVTFISGSPQRCKSLQSVNTQNTGNTYGDSYNAIVGEAFKLHDEIIVVNDDVVLTPSTYAKLTEDLEFLHGQGHKVGWLGARSDFTHPMQLVQNLDPNLIHRASRVSPLFAYVSRQAWVDYPPINWYSDDIQCADMVANGYEHFVSRAYVHHVGSQTIGVDNQKNHLQPREWIKTNRPDMYERFYEVQV
jgi:hypothetical protein